MKRLTKTLIVSVSSILFLFPLITFAAFTVSQGGTANANPPSTNALIYFDGTKYTGTSSDPLYVGKIVATSTGTSTLVGGISASVFCLSGSPSVCLGSTGTINSGTTGQIPYYAASGINLTPTSTIFIATNSNVGIGSTSPSSKLSVNGTLSAATTTLSGDLVFSTNANHIISPMTTASPKTLTVSGGSASAVGGNGAALILKGGSGSGNIGPNVFIYGGQEDTPGNVILAHTGSSATGMVGIGTSTAIKLLTVDGDQLLTGGLFDSTYSAGTNGMVLQTTGSVTQWVATSTLGIGGITSIATNNGLTGGPITTTGTIGLNTTGLSTNSLVTWNGSNLVATGTPSLTVGSLISTTTATSTFTGGITANILNTSSTTASSTFANGVNLTGGCFSINGTCLSSGGGSGTVNSGTAGQNAFYASSGTAVSGTSTIFTDTSSAVGIGTTTPTTNSRLTIQGKGLTTNHILSILGSNGIEKAYFQDNGNLNFTSPVGTFIQNTVGSLTFNTGNFLTFTDPVGDSMQFGGGGATITANDTILLATAGYGDGLFNMTSSGIVNMGDCAGDFNNTCFAIDDSTGIITSNAAGSMQYTTPTFTTSGKFGVGTTSPYASLSVQSNASTGDALVVATSTGNAIGGFDNDGHQFTSGPAPVISSCGTGTGTVVGDDQGGTITTATAATSCTLTFSKAYRNIPYVMGVSDNSIVISAAVTSITTTAVTFSISGAGLTAGKIYYSFGYHK